MWVGCEVAGAGHPALCGWDAVLQERDTRAIWVGCSVAGAGYPRYMGWRATQKNKCK